MSTEQKRLNLYLIAIGLIAFGLLLINLALQPMTYPSPVCIVQTGTLSRVVDCTTLTPALQERNLK